MENKKLQEFEDDAGADKAVVVVASSLKNILRSVSSKKDFARVAEALMKFMINNKDILKTNVPNDPNYKQVLVYLNKMQSDLDSNKPAVGTKENPAMVKPVA